MSTKYTPEFKEQAVALYLKSNTTYAAVARELGCDPGSLSDWAKKILLFNGCNYRSLLFSSPLFRGLFHF